MAHRSTPAPDFRGSGYYPRSDVSCPEDAQAAAGQFDAELLTPAGLTNRCCGILGSLVTGDLQAVLFVKNLTRPLQEWADDSGPIRPIVPASTIPCAPVNNVERNCITLSYVIDCGQEARYLHRH